MQKKTTFGGVKNKTALHSNTYSKMDQKRHSLQGRRKVQDRPPPSPDTCLKKPCGLLLKQSLTGVAGAVFTGSSIAGKTLQQLEAAPPAPGPCAPPAPPPLQPQLQLLLTQRAAPEQDSASERSGRGAVDPARVAEEVRGALQQAGGRADVVDAQEAAAGEGHAPATLAALQHDDRGGRSPATRTEESPARRLMPKRRARATGLQSVPTTLRPRPLRGQCRAGRGGRKGGHSSGGRGLVSRGGLAGIWVMASRQARRVGRGDRRPVGLFAQRLWLQSCSPYLAGSKRH